MSLGEHRDRWEVEGFEFFVHATRTRFPFRYGIASMTEVPHLFVRARLVVGGKSSLGLASEGLPPKWFTKDPTTHFEQDLPALFGTVGSAAAIGASAEAGRGFFEWWRQLTDGQAAWARRRGHPALLAGLGSSLVERAVLDGLCRAWGVPLHRVVRENRLGIRLGELHGALGTSEPRDWLPEVPHGEVLIRHTLGLGDALTAADLAEGERVEDGLPQTLEESVRAYRLRAFKIKLFGVPERDVARIEAVRRVLEAAGIEDFLVTLDGNENFKEFGAFRSFWERFREAPALEAFRKRVVFVEQPVHRDHALAQGAAEALAAWKSRPQLIIDESDGALADLPRALALGYDGSSHKNCKGIVKGIAHACLLASRRREGRAGILSGEDLCNLGPVALLQDLASMAFLGVPHVERNGHHYFRGLTPWPDVWQEWACREHPDLYVRDPAGFARLSIREGRVRLATVNEAPFGVRPRLDPEAIGLKKVQLNESGIRSD